MISPCLPDGNHNYALKFRFVESINTLLIDPMPYYGKRMIFDRFARLAAAIAILIGVAVVVIALRYSPYTAFIATIAGAVAAWLVTYPDATAVVNEVRIVEPTDNMQTLLTALDDPALHLRDGRVACANQPALMLLGGHIIGVDVKIAIRHPAAADILSAPHLGGVVEVTGLGQREQVWELRVAPLRDNEQLVQLIDRTARYAAERARVDFVANVSHELRTPLSTILGFIETLGDEKAGGVALTRNRFLGVMQGEAKRMQVLIDDLISLSRIEAERYELPTTAVDLAALIKSVAAEFLNDDGRKRDEISLNLTADLAFVSGDHEQLRQLIHNLIENAIKYGGGKAVDVSLQATAGGQLVVSVSDHGEGIAPEHIPRLTERFYRVDPGRSRAAGGTGLGLSIAKHIIERHKGRLAITSVVGTGTTVSVTMNPIAHVAADAVT